MSGQRGAWHSIVESVIWVCVNDDSQLPFKEGTRVRGEHLSSMVVTMTTLFVWRFYHVVCFNVVVTSCVDSSLD